MTFKEAFEAMKHGAKVKLPSWAGYWFWSIPAQSILMHTKDGNDIDIRQTEIPDYTFGNIGSDEWIFATGENCPALGGMNMFSFSEAIKQVKKKRKVTRLLHGTEWHLQLAYGDYSFAHGREEFRFTSDDAIIILVHDGDKDVCGREKAEQYVPTQEDMLAEDWVFAEQED
ncbi:Thoeris anti-defense Tad2 family protein [Agathobacter sp.]|uniref:Thoeris anti-defense Tad2 family protein n=1 Tax=Agathobacter sp. TaxID=2021311 RepID=UPI003AEFB944